MSKTDLALKLGISPQAMRMFVNGEKDPSLMRLHTIAEALGMKVRELFE